LSPYRPLTQEKKKRDAMFVSDFDQSKCFLRLPEKLFSTITARLFTLLLKGARKSIRYLAIFDLSTDVDKYVCNSNARFH
jgi:hypothetical protein